MRSIILACLLIVAGVSAFPQDVDVASTEGRIVDLVILDVIQRYKDWMEAFDPWLLDDYKFDDTIIDDLVHLKGFVEEFKIAGLSGVTINNLQYNLVLGRLDLDISLDKIVLSVGKYNADIRYGNRGGTVVVSGDLEIENIRFRGDALLLVYPGSPVTILNINTLLTVDDVRADLTVSWQCLGCWEPTDYSSEANELANVLIPGWLVTYAPEIGTILGEVIRYIVNWVWGPY